MAIKILAYFKPWCMKYIGESNAALEKSKAFKFSIPLAQIALDRVYFNLVAQCCCGLWFCCYFVLFCLQLPNAI